MEKEEAGMKRKAFAGKGQDGSSSGEEQKKMCCTALAMSVYNKALESAKKAIPSKSGSEEVLGSGKKGKLQTLSPRSQDSQDSGEASFDYEDFDDCPDLTKEFMMGEEGRMKRNSERRERSDLMASLRDQSSASGSELEFYDELGSPEDIDLEKFKAQYLSGKVILKDDDELEVTDQGVKIKKEGKKEKEADEKKKKAAPVETFARKTSFDVLKAAGDELTKRNSLEGESRPLVVVEVIKGEGIFKKHHHGKEVKDQEVKSSQSKTKIKNEMSTEDSFDDYSVDLPTITITEDTLGDTISQSTLRGSLDEEIPDDTESKMSMTAIKSKVKDLKFKVKDMFSKDPEAEERKEEMKKKKEEETKKKREEELRKKELELVRKEFELKKKEEETRKREEEKARKAEEKKLKDEQKKEEEQRKKEEMIKKKEEEHKRKEEEQKKKEDLLRKKEEEIERRRKETEEKLMREKEDLVAEAERMKQKVILSAIEAEMTKEGIKIDQALRQAQEIDAKLAAQHEAMKSKKKVTKQKVKVKVTKTDPELDNLGEESAMEMNEGSTAMASIGDMNISTDRFTNSELGNTTLGSSSDTLARGQATTASNLSINHDDDTFKEDRELSVSPDKKVSKDKKEDSKFLNTVPSFDADVQPRVLQRSNTNATATDDELFIAIESEGGYYEESQNQNGGRRKKKMTKKIRDTKNRLKIMTNKALEASVASMQTIRSKVTDMFVVGGKTADSSPYSSVKRRDEQFFNAYRERLPDDEFFSDSEVVESRRDTFREEATRMRQPSRPPRRTNREGSSAAMDESPDLGGRRNLMPAFSDPNLSKRPPAPKPGFRNKRPDRPPPPSNRQTPERMTTTTGSESAITMQSVGQWQDVQLNGHSARSSVERAESVRPVKVDPRPYYLAIRQEWHKKHPHRVLKPSRVGCVSEPVTRSIKVSRTAASDVNLASKPPAAPRRASRGRLSETPTRSECITAIDGTPKAPPRKKRDRSIEPSMDRSFLSLSVHSSGQNIYHPYFPAQHYPRGSSRTKAGHYNSGSSFNPTVGYTDTIPNSLGWRPFSWKTGRCRSLTELYLQKQNLIYANEEVDFENSLRYKLTQQYCPPRNPEFEHDHYVNISSARPPICPRIKVSKEPEPIYSVIRKRTKRSSESPSSIQERPLPNVPVPQSMSPLLGRSLIRPSSSSSKSGSVSPCPSPGGHSSQKDAAVSTRDERSKTLEREVQTSLEDISSIRTEGIKPPSIKSDLVKSSATQIQSITPVQQVDAATDENANFPAAAASPVLAVSSSGTAKRTSGDELSGASSRTVGSYYDAESCGQDDHDIEEHFDQDTFAGLDSIAADNTLSTSGTSQFMSLNSSTPTKAMSFHEEHKSVTVVSSDRMVVTERTSTSTRPLTPTISSSRPLSMGASSAIGHSSVIGRRTGRTRTGTGMTELDTSDEETEIVDLAAELHQELRQMLERRTSQNEEAKKDWDKDW